MTSLSSRLSLPTLTARFSEITDSLWQEYEAFWDHSLAEYEVAHLFPDAVFEPLRRTETSREGILCAWCITLEGKRVLLHLALATRKATRTGLNSYET